MREDNWYNVGYVMQGKPIQLLLKPVFLPDIVIHNTQDGNTMQLMDLKNVMDVIDYLWG
jgi:hypothetical protein